MSDYDRRFTIRLSAVLDRNTSAVGQPLAVSMRAARAQVEADARSASRTVEALAARSAASAAKMATAEAVARANAAKAASTAEGKAFDERLKRAQKHHADVEAYLAKQVALHRQETASAEREEAKRASSAARAQARTDRGRLNTAKGVASESFANMGKVASGAMSLAGNVARGAGVNLDVGSMVGKSVRLQQIAVDTTNSGFVKGEKGPKGEFQDPRKLEAEVRAAASQPLARLDTIDVGEGVAEFVKRTGDLQTARDMMKDLAVFARGTGTSFKDTAGVAAEIGNALGDVPDKSNAILRAMRGLTAEGKLGAVEFSDLAKQFGKLAASSGKFAGEGANQGEQRVDAILKLGAMAQLGRAEGGAWNANVALSALTSFTSTLGKGARRKEFERAGVQLEDERGYFRNPIEIIKQSLKSTGGDAVKMDALFKDVQGKRAIDSFTKTYREAGGGDKGLAAIDEKFEGIFKGTRDFTQRDVETQAARSAGTPEAKAQAFNNQMEQVVSRLAERVLPQMDQLGGKALEVANALSSIVGWAAENPGSAITAAIVGSIAKAALGSAVKTALVDMMGMATKGGAGLGGIGGVASALAVGAASFMITRAVIEIASTDVAKGQNKSSDADVVAINALSQYNAAMRGEGGPEAKEKALASLQKAKAAEAARITAAENPDSYLGALNPFGDTTFTGAAAQKADADKLPELREDMARLEAAISKLSTTTLKVNVENMPAGGGPELPTGGRRGVGGK